MQKANIRRRMTKRRNLRSTTKTVRYCYQRARGIESPFDAFERNRSEHEPIGSWTGFPNCHAGGTGVVVKKDIDYYELRCRFISNSGQYFTYILNERNAKETNKIKYGTTSRWTIQQERQPHHDFTATTNSIRHEEWNRSTFQIAATRIDGSILVANNTIATLNLCQEHLCTTHIQYNGLRPNLSTSKNRS